MVQAATWGVPLVSDAPVSPSVMAQRMDDSVDALLTSHSGVSRPSYALAGTVWLNSGDPYLQWYDGTIDKQIVSLETAAPTLATDAGTTGMWAIDVNYIYVCVGTNTWKRAELTTW